MAVPPRQTGRWRGAVRAGAVALGAVFVAALAVFVTSRPVVVARFPRRQPHPPGLHDLAAIDYGPVVTASSCEPAGHHHPAFLVDRRLRPTPLEKWASDSADRHPWVELEWGEPHELAEVVVVQGAAFEEARYLTRRLRVTCLRDRSRAAERLVSAAASVERVALPCPGATGVRLEFFLDSPSDIVRVYEIEAWGR